MSIYKKFCNEILDEEGKLAKLTLDYPENFNFGYDVVDAIADEQPQKTALVWCNTINEEHIFTFQDIKNYSNKMANVFKEAGICRGDRVMLVLKRHYEYWFALVALHKLGATAIPATHMLTVKDLVYRIKAANVKAIVCTSDDDVPEKIRTAASGSGLDIKLWTVRKNCHGFDNLSEQTKFATDEFPREYTLATDHMLLYFTSGTTGEPKGVIHDFTYPLAHIATAKYWQQAEDGGLHFTVAETGWAKASWGKIYGQWLLGSAVMAYDFDSFEPKQLIAIINRYGVTSFCAPPTVYRYLVRKGIEKMPTLKHATTAGEQLAPEVFRKFTEITGLPLCEGYGQTETTLLTGNFYGVSTDGSMGSPSPFYDVRLVDNKGKPVKTGEIGEVVIVPPENGRQAGIFCAYLDNETQYNYVWRGGVYHTGDAAYMDENGMYWFHGRFDDIIKTGGFRVGPYEVENILSEHPAVGECSVIGVSDPLRGQAIKAVIILAKGYKPSRELERSIKNFCNSRLAEYKWIRMIEFVDEMPKTISGKIRKNIQRSQG